MPVQATWVNLPIRELIPDLLGCDDVKPGWDRGSSSTKMHIRIYWHVASGPLRRLPPMQTRGIPSSQSKTSVAQMHFASEFPLPRGETKYRWPKDEHPRKSGMNP
jgi:hypothetical protein